MTCRVEFVLFKPSYVKIAFIASNVVNFSSYESLKVPELSASYSYLTEKIPHIPLLLD